MAFDPELGDAVSRIRAIVGDMADPPLMPGGETLYETLIAQNPASETAAALAAARYLAAYYATQPDSVSASGESVRWSERVSQWNATAARLATDPTAQSSTARRSTSEAITFVW